MNRLKRPRLLAAGAGGIATLALAGTLLSGTAFAASSTATPTTGSQSGTQTSMIEQFEQRLAQNLGVSVDQVKSALQKTADQSVDDAVASGKLTQDQGNAMKEQIDSGQDVPFLLGGFGDRHGGPGFGHDQSTIAGTLGITEQQLQSELQGGKALKDVITEHGKTVDDVVNAVIAHEKSELDQAVQSGKLTADQENQRLSDLKQQLTDAINNNTMPTKAAGPHGGAGTPGGQNPSQSATPTG